MNEQNIILDTDSYKSSHFLQYPPGTTHLHAYLESRGGHFAYTRFFGLQYILKRYLTQRITRDMVEEAEAILTQHGEPFPKDGWMYIVERLDGRLPLEIRCVPEGFCVPTHNVLMSVVNTDPHVPWVVSWFETMLMRVWYPTTVATISHSIKRVIREALEQSCDSPETELSFKLHDFGSRGVSSRESAGIGGCAHLTNFMGTDTVEALRVARTYYGEDMAGYSIPAAEHSTITSWGKEHEVDAYRNMVRTFGKPGKIYAVVSDSYDLKQAINQHWGTTLREEIIQSGATLVVRPDSGDPAAVVRMAIGALEKKFGTQTNAKGFKVLNHVRVIQGDGINEESIREILSVILQDGFSAENVAFGMGGALLQQLDRDTQKFAYKTSAAMVDGAYRGVYKDPVTDPRKRSKDGILDLVKRNGRISTIRSETFGVYAPDSLLQLVFRNGEMTVDETLGDIRQRDF